MHRSVALALAMLACGSGDEAPASAPELVAPPAATVAPPAAEPSPAAGTSPPAATAAADPARGAAQYQTLCASCHGARGAGDGPAGQALTPRPARHDDGSYMNPLSNEHVFRVIKEGGAAVGKSPMMAPWGAALSDDQIRDVVAFIRSLAEPPYTGPKP